MSEYKCPSCNGEFEQPAEDFKGLKCPWCGHSMEATKGQLNRGEL